MIHLTPDQDWSVQAKSKTQRAWSHHYATPCFAGRDIVRSVHRLDAEHGNLGDAARRFSIEAANSAAEPAPPPVGGGQPLHDG
jgi:hypothetical protein